MGEDNVVFRWFSEKDDETNTKDRVRLEQCDGSSSCPRIYSLQEDNHRLGIYGSDTDDQKYYICQAVLMLNGTLRAENSTKCSDSDILECDETYTFVRVKPRLAALYPTIGIILQVGLGVIFDVMIRNYCQSYLTGDSHLPSHPIL